MSFLLLSLLVAVVSSQTTDFTTGLGIDVVNSIPWGKTDSVTITNGSSQKCQCLPYYNCNENRIAVDVFNVSVSGYSVINARFDDDTLPPPCTASVETCCQMPTNQTEPGDQQTLFRPQSNPAKIKGCGYRNPNGIGAYFDGPSTQFGEYPWVVALLDARNNSCAGVGVLINPEVVMTGAYIAYKYAPGDLKIRAGEYDTQTDKEIFPHQERAVSEIYNHKDFNRRSLLYNIALLRLDRPVELAEHINVICLPEQDEVFDSHKNCIANGWGKDKFGIEGHYAVFLKTKQLNMVPRNRCEQMLKRTRLGPRFKLHDTFLCAGGEEEDTCQGDGGAPLACPAGNDRYKLTGLVAWGVGCGQKDVPAAYTNVPMFRSWVDDKMREWGLQTWSF